MTLYLKYRPQTVEELDLVVVRDQIHKILRSSEIPHAWLLTGTRGTGKTSTARIVAKFVNCEGKDRPCNKCDMCKEITNGKAVDVVEIDAASNRGIDEIRSLKEKIALAPMRSRYKVFIIDEAHMLTSEAMNALLKTLEEPPKNTLFFLCTTEENKLLETVVSRCVRIEFKKPSIAEISLKLLQVAQGEKFKLKKEEAELISKKARGSFRDAIKILEQVIISGKMETEVDNEILDLVLNNKKDEAIAEIEKLAEKGANFRSLIETLMESLHEKLLETKDVRLIGLVDGLQNAYERTKTAVVEQMPLEIWVIEMTEGHLNSKSEILSTKQIQKPNDQSMNAPSKSPSLIKEGEGGVRSVSEKHAKFSLQDLTSRWGEILKKVKPMNHSVEALLRSTKPLDFDGEKLTLEVFYQFHLDKLNSDKCRQIVEVSVGEIFDNPPIKLFMKLGKKDKGIKDEVSAKGVDEEVITAAEAIFKVSAI